ncbi:Uncharacterised protein [Atlantibacter hermannii]|nr:Uncharacterised protein [Atlantibacter hermannii]
MSRSKGWWRLFKRRSSFCIAGWGLFWILWKGGASAAGAFRAVERFRSLGAFSSTEAALTANVSGALPAAPRHPRLPANKIGGSAASLASISSLQVGRDTASCLSRPHPRIPAGMTWLVNSGSAILMPDPTPQLSDFYVLQDGFCRCEITPPIHAFLFIFPYSSRHFSPIKKPEIIAGVLDPIALAEACAGGRG